MMSNSADVLTEVFVDVLEKVAFMFAELPEDDQEFDAPGDCVKVSMSFQGRACGNLSLTAPEPLCVSLAANVLGVDEDDDQAKEGGFDALKELLNVICGNLMTTLMGEDQAFDLSVPSIEHVGQVDWEELAKAPGAILFVVDDESPMLVQLQDVG